jgi:hypothetical protein
VAKPEITPLRARIREKSWLARIASWKLGEKQVAMVMGRTVHLANTTREEFLEDKTWVCHEIIHLLQYRQYGLIGFWWRYLWDYVRYGYHQIRFEKEARAGEKDERFLERVIFD